MRVFNEQTIQGGCEVFLQKNFSDVRNAQEWSGKAWNGGLKFSYCLVTELRNDQALPFLNCLELGMTRDGNRGSLSLQGL
jgi:hypothetical protein